jgi:hypothetical protein
VEVIIDTKKNRCLLTYSTIDPASYDGWGLFFFGVRLDGKTVESVLLKGDLNVKSLWLAHFLCSCMGQ